MNRKQIWIAATGVFFLLSLWLLAGSVTQFEFRDGYFFYNTPTEDASGLPGGVAASGRPMPDWVRIFLFILVWILFPASILMLIFNPRSLKTILMRAAVIVSWVLLAFVISQAIDRFGLLSNLGSPSDGAGGIPGSAFDPFPDASTIVMPWWTQWLASILAMVIGLWLIWRIYHVWLVVRGKPDLEGELAEEAAMAAESLRAGAPLREVVLRCYQRMCELLQTRQSRRSASLTPREFEQQLRRAGIDDPHVARLSRLFERVRYGPHQAASEDEQEALSCLEGIEMQYRSEL